MKLLYSILGALSLLILSASARDEVSCLTKMKEILKSHKAFSYNCQLIETNSDDASESDTTNYQCLFKNVPTDTSIGVYYQFKDNGIISRIYNGDAIYEYEPKTYGKKIVNQILRKNKPEEFSEEEVIMGGKTYYAPSSVKNYFGYWFSPVEFLNDSNIYSKLLPAKDTIISGKFLRIYKYESDGIYLEIAFDTVSCLPMFFQTNQVMRHILTATFDNYNFIDKNVLVSFQKAIFPKGMRFVNSAPRIEKKEKNKL